MTFRHNQSVGINFESGGDLKFFEDLTVLIATFFF